MSDDVKKIMMTEAVPGGIFHRDEHINKIEGVNFHVLLCWQPSKCT